MIFRHSEFCSQRGIFLGSCARHICDGACDRSAQDAAVRKEADRASYWDGVSIRVDALHRDCLHFDRSDWHLRGSRHYSVRLRSRWRPQVSNFVKYSRKIQAQQHHYLLHRRRSRLVNHNDDAFVRFRAGLHARLAANGAPGGQLI